MEIAVCVGLEVARAGEDGVGGVGGELLDEFDAEAAIGSCGWGVSRR